MLAFSQLLCSIVTFLVVFLIAMSKNSNGKLDHIYSVNLYEIKPINIPFKMCVL